MFQPARLKSEIVASCRLPFGRPSRSLLATGGLFLTNSTQCNRLGKAAHCALMANKPIALNLHAKKERVIVAIRRRGHDSQPIAAGFALHPKLLASATPKSHEACFYCLGVA